jgi:hypothetical protein
MGHCVVFPARGEAKIVGTNKRTPWLQLVCRSIESDLHRIEDSRIRLANALLWRGFFAGTDDTGVLIYRGNQKADRMDLKTLSRLLRVTPADEDGVIARVSLNAGAQTRWTQQIRAILQLPSPWGMTASGIRYTSWASFKKCRFGYGLPVIELDLGVALLVRALPLVSVPTRLSGHGVSEPRLYIEFDGAYAACWFKYLFENHLSQHLQRPDVFRVDLSREGGRLVIGREASSNDNVVASFQAAQDLARWLMDERLAGRLRRLKQAVCSQFNDCPDVNRFYQKCCQMSVLSM